MKFRGMIAKATIGFVAAVAAQVIQSGSVSAQGVSARLAGVGANALASCATGRIESVANNLPIRDTPFIDSPVYTVAQQGYRYDCEYFDPNGYYLGGRYTACGVANGNGWIIVKFRQADGFTLHKYTYQACVKDV